MFGKILTFSFLCAAFIAPAHAFDKEKDKAEMERVMAKYESTGKVKNCVMLSQVDTTKVFDDYNILFEMTGNKAYLNTLPRRCSRLGFEESFSYKVSSNQLCNVDLITVFDASSGMHGPSCSLGKFVEYKKKDKDEKDQGSE